MQPGLSIVVSPLATKPVRRAAVERLPISKRRRRWRVAIREVLAPTAYELPGNVLLCHPEIYAALQQRIPGGPSAS